MQNGTGLDWSGVVQVPFPPAFLRCSTEGGAVYPIASYPLSTVYFASSGLRCAAPLLAKQQYPRSQKTPQLHKPIINH
jgi:hypothetical protein